jgi:hypothetical protein
MQSPPQVIDAEMNKQKLAVTLRENKALQATMAEQAEASRQQEAEIERLKRTLIGSKRTREATESEDEEDDGRTTRGRRALPQSLHHAIEEYGDGSTRVTCPGDHFGPIGPEHDPGRGQARLPCCLTC